MSPTGIYRRIDRLGRIVLPMELRRALEIAEGDQLTIVQEGERIVLCKVERACTFCGSVDDLRSHRSKLICARCASEVAAALAGPRADSPTSVTQSRVATS
ncbi:MAG: AbrB/MazE/SpoVT family DNA-binding domain-containing protein [Actinomycetota bacterium]|nr:AbrB/MazE/SpoVT family DNA-binding domain-containing protein [Actinomycetota bacterium]